MTIGATDVALCDLGSHALPIPRSQERIDRRRLTRTVTVIEVEYPQIRRATVDAGMFGKISEYKRTEALTLGRVAASRLRQVLFTIVSVVLFGVRALALLALGRAAPGLRVLERKVVDRKRALARRTVFDACRRCGGALNGRGDPIGQRGCARTESSAAAAPIELFGRALAMTVGTPHVALRDFKEYCGPRLASR